MLMALQLKTPPGAGFLVKLILSLKLKKPVKPLQRDLYLLDVKGDFERIYFWEYG